MIVKTIFARMFKSDPNKSFIFESLKMASSEDNSIKNETREEGDGEVVAPPLALALTLSLAPWVPRFFGI